MENKLRQNFEMSFIKSNKQLSASIVNCNYQIMNKDICRTFSFIFFSVEKIIVFDKVKKFKILVQKNVFL